MKIAATLALFAAASTEAFTASQSGRMVTSLAAEKSASLPFMNKPDLLDGSMAGDVGFDPLGLSTIDAVGIDLYWLREAEIKHCRVAMLATAGFLWVETFGPAPGCEAATAKNQMDAFWQLWAVHPQYIVFSFILIGITEMISGIAATSGRESGMRAPGDFTFDPLGFGKDPKKLEDLKLKEVKNGRLAMWAAAGMILQGTTTGAGCLENMTGF